MTMAGSLSSLEPLFTSGNSATRHEQILSVKHFVLRAQHRVYLSVRSNKVGRNFVLTVFARMCLSVNMAVRILAGW